MQTSSPTAPILSIVVPLYNERGGLPAFHTSLIAVLNTLRGDSYEIIYCNDGSADDTLKVLWKLAEKDNHIRILSLTKNFGKEVATTAGIQAARGEAVITIDGDGQQPVELLPRFVKRWRDGAKVVVGLRLSNQREGTIKRQGSKLFYTVLNRLLGIHMVAGASDYRLIDRVVQQEFVRLTERGRMTRALIDWLGYEQKFIMYKAKARQTDQAGYSFRKLFGLAINSFISLSVSPLYLTAYIGAIVLPVSTLIGVGMLGNWLLRDPLGLHATGGAYLMVFILFLIGILLVSQGIIGLYLSYIHTETQNRPLYVVDQEHSKGM